MTWRSQKDQLILQPRLGRWFSVDPKTENFPVQWIPDQWNWLWDLDHPDGNQFREKIVCQKIHPGNRILPHLASTVLTARPPMIVMELLMIVLMYNDGTCTLLWCTCTLLSLDYSNIVASIKYSLENVNTTAIRNSFCSLSSLHIYSNWLPCDNKNLFTYLFLPKFITTSGCLPTSGVVCRLFIFNNNQAWLTVNRHSVSHPWGIF